MTIGSETGRVVVHEIAAILGPVTGRASSEMAAAGGATKRLLRGFVQGRDQSLVPFDFDPDMVQWFTLINRHGAPVGVGYQLSDVGAKKGALWARGMPAHGVAAYVEGDFAKYPINGFSHDRTADVPVDGVVLTPWPALCGVPADDLKRVPDLKERQPTVYVTAEGTQGMLAFSVLDKTGRATTVWATPDTAAQIIAANPRLHHLLGQESHLALLAPFAGFGGTDSPASAVASELHRSGRAITVHAPKTFMRRDLRFDTELPDGGAEDPSVLNALMEQADQLRPVLALDVRSPFGVQYAQGGAWARFPQ